MSFFLPGPFFFPPQISLCPELFFYFCKDSYYRVDFLLCAFLFSSLLIFFVFLFIFLCSPPSVFLIRVLCFCQVTLVCFVCLRGFSLSFLFGLPFPPPLFFPSYMISYHNCSCRPPCFWVLRPCSTFFFLESSLVPPFHMAYVFLFTISASILCAILRTPLPPPPLQCRLFTFSFSSFKCMQFLHAPVHFFLFVSHLLDFDSRFSPYPLIVFSDVISFPVT